MEHQEVEPELSTVPHSYLWLTGSLATAVIASVVLALIVQHERTSRRLAEDHLESVFRLEDFACSLANTPDAPDKRRLEESSSCATAAIKLVRSHPEDVTAARLIYRLAGELYFIVGIRGSSPSDLINARSCLKQVHVSGGTRDPGVAMRLAEDLHAMGVSLADSQLDVDALSCFQLAMEIGGSHVKQGESRFFLSVYGRSYDAFANLCKTPKIIEQEVLRARASNGFREAVDLWTHLREEDPESPSCRLGLASSHFNYAIFLHQIGHQKESVSHLSHVFKNLKPLTKESSYREVLLYTQAISFRAVLQQRDSELVDTIMTELQLSLQYLRSTPDMSAPTLVADLRKLARNLRKNGLNDEATVILHACTRVVEEHSSSFETITHEQIIDEIEEINASRGVRSCVWFSGRQSSNAFHRRDLYVRPRRGASGEIVGSWEQGA